MNNGQVTFPMPGGGHAVLTLPRQLPDETLLELERSLAAVLGNLRHQTRVDALDRAEIEYASWLQVLRAEHH